MNKKDNQNDNEQEKMLKLGERALSVISIFFVVIVIIYALNFGIEKFSLSNLLEKHILLSPKQEVWGQFGDFIGGSLNPLIGFITVYFVWVNVRLQKKELIETREEIKRSDKTVQLQSFQQTFFTWLESYRDIVKSIVSFEEYEDPKSLSHVKDQKIIESRGLTALHKAYQNELSNEHITKIIDKSTITIFAHKTQKPIEPNPQTVQRYMLLSWEDIYKKHEHYIDSMFRTLYNIIKWIDGQNEEFLTNEQKWQYVSIIRSQLSNIELTYLFFNGFTNRGEKFNRLINYYAIFDNLSYDNEYAIQIFKELESCPFPEAAFDSDVARSNQLRTNPAATLHPNNS